MNKFLFATITMLLTSPALAVTGMTGAVLAAYFGFDPGTWIVGAVGGAIVQVKTPPVSKSVAVANGVISVMSAGLGADYIVTLATFKHFPSPSIYLVAFILSTLWPFGLTIAKALTERWSKK